MAQKIKPEESTPWILVDLVLKLEIQMNAIQKVLFKFKMINRNIISSHTKGDNFKYSWNEDLPFLLPIN